jgi:gluconolactonase
MGGIVQSFATEVAFPEAPVFLPDGSLLIVEMGADKGCVTHLSADGSSRRQLARTGRPNGLALDRNGAIWIAETAQRAVLKMDLTGRTEVVANACGNDPFLFLNDLAFAPNGDLYVTDSGVLLADVAPGGELNPNYRSLRYDGRVYRIDPRSREVEIIDRGMLFTNGIAFGPDSALYVTETLSGNIYRYDYANGRVTGGRERFGNVIEHFDPAQLKGPDGMKFAADGTLYAAVFGQGDITVLDRNGAVARRIKTNGTFPTNLAFAKPGARQIYVTEVETSSVQVHDVGTDGLPLHT